MIPPSLCILSTASHLGSAVRIAEPIPPVYRRSKPWCIEEKVTPNPYREKQSPVYRGRSKPRRIQKERSLPYTGRGDPFRLQEEAVPALYRENVTRHVYREKRSPVYTGDLQLPDVYRRSHPRRIEGEVIPAVYRMKRSHMYTERDSQGKDLNTLTLLFHKRTSRVSTGLKRHIYLLILDY